MKNNEELNTRKVSKLPIILIIILLLAIVGIVCVSIFYEPPKKGEKNDVTDLVNDTKDLVNDVIDSVEDTSGKIEGLTNDDNEEVDDSEEWEKDCKYVSSAIETNELNVQKNIKTDFKLNDLCLSTLSNTPTNITQYMDKIYENINSNMFIGCYRENGNISVLLIPYSYDNIFIKKINFVDGVMNVSNYEINGTKVICTVNATNIISCK